MIEVEGNEADAKTAAQLLNLHGPIEKFPSDVLGDQRDLALLFKKLATLRTDARLFKNVEKLKSRGVEFIGPEAGMLACGYEGLGRLWKVEDIAFRAEFLLHRHDRLIA